MQKITILLMMFALLAYSCHRECLYHQKQFLGKYTTTFVWIHPPNLSSLDTVYINETEIKKVSSNEEAIDWENDQFGYIDCNKGEYTFELNRSYVKSTIKFKNDMFVLTANYPSGDSLHCEGIKIK